MRIRVSRRPIEIRRESFEDRGNHSAMAYHLPGFHFPNDFPLFQVIGAIAFPTDNPLINPSIPFRNRKEWFWTSFAAGQR